MLFPLVATVALIWGFSFIAMNEMLKAAEPIQILTVRWTLTAFFFLIPVVMGKIRLKLSRKAWLFALLTG
ncbi:MAG: EamA family transporter, partial [Clostridia bacterium]|nr:EamA family transporter [Clostridia bacterium]